MFLQGEHWLFRGVREMEWGESVPGWWGQGPVCGGGQRAEARPRVLIRAPRTANFLTEASVSIWTHPGWKGATVAGSA